MSGPKCASYWVEDNQRIEQLAREQALAAAREAERRLAELAKREAVWKSARASETHLAALGASSHRALKELNLAPAIVGEPPPAPSNRASISEIESYVFALQKHMRAIEDEVRHATAAHEISQLIARLQPPGLDESLSERSAWGTERPVREAKIHALVNSLSGAATYDDTQAICQTASKSFQVTASKSFQLVRLISAVFHAV